MKFLILTILLITNVLLNAQVTFSKTFCDSIQSWRRASAQSRKIIELNNGYLFAFAGASLSLQQGSFLTLVKTNQWGEEVWRIEKQSFEFRFTVGEIALDNDSNIYVYYIRDTSATSLTGRIGIVMLDKYRIDGELIWQKPYYNEIAPYNVRPTSISLSNDLIYLSGVWIDLDLTTQLNSYYNTALYCINKNTGELQWIKSYDTGSKDDYNDDLLISDDEHIYLSGLTNGLGASGFRGHLIKTGIDGNMIWQKLYPEIGDGGVMTINYFEDEKYILTGYNFNPNQSGVRGKIIKIDTSGSIHQTLTFPEGTLSVTLYRTTKISDGNLVSVGISGCDGKDCGLIQKSSPNGNVIWRHCHSYNEFNSHFLNFKETYDNNFIVIGSAREEETGQDTWLLKLDSNGCLEPGCLEVGIEEAELEMGIIVYPNPTQDRLFIKMEQNLKKPLHFSLYNLQGKLLIQEQLVAEYESFDLSSLSTGVYLVHIIDNNGKKVSRKIIKN